jgi:hypothetical protein
VPPGDAELLAQEIRQTLECDSLADAASRRVRSYAETVADLSILFQELLLDAGPRTRRREVGRRAAPISNE